MAGKGRPAKTKVEDTKSLDLEKQNEDLKKENEEIKNKFEDLSSMFKSMMEEFKQVKEQKVEEKPKQESIVDEYKDIHSRYPVFITSLYHGGLNLLGMNGTEIRFDKFGETRRCYFEDVEVFGRKNKSFIEKGWLFIHDERVLKLLYVDTEYSKMIQPETFKNLVNLPSEEIKSVYNSTTEYLQEEIVNLFANTIVKDEDSLDKNKIALINELSGKDVKKVAELIKSYKIKK